MKLFPNSNNILPQFCVGDSQGVDFAVIFDSDKLFLFKILHFDFVQDFEKHLAKSIDVFKRISKNISGGEIYCNIGGSVKTLSNIKYEVIPVVLIKSASSMACPIMENVHGKPFLLAGFLDFLSLSDDIEDGMKFLKFLRRYDDVQDRTQINSFGLLDEYAWYVKNGDCFLTSGMPSYMTLLPGFWDEYHVKKLKGRPDFQPRLSDHEPDDVWDVKVVSDGIFQVRNHLARQTAGVFRIGCRAIWILASSVDSEYNSDEIRSFNLFTQLIPHRLVKNDAFEVFLQKIGAKIDQQIHLMLHPSSFIKRQKIRSPLSNYLWDLR